MGGQPAPGFGVNGLLLRPHSERSVLLGDGAPGNGITSAWISGAKPWWGRAMGSSWWDRYLLPDSFLAITGPKPDELTGGITLGLSKFA